MLVSSSACMRKRMRRRHRRERREGMAGRRAGIVLDGRDGEGREGRGGEAEEEENVGAGERQAGWEGGVNFPRLLEELGQVDRREEPVLLLRGRLGFLVDAIVAMEERGH